MEPNKTKRLATMFSVILNIPPRSRWQAVHLD
jgi:hypothetical protein